MNLKILKFHFAAKCETEAETVQQVTYLEVSNQKNELCDYFQILKTPKHILIQCY